MKQADFINGCIKVENSIASIYSRLMQLFPGERDFWQSLLQDERDHIAFLTDVKTLGLITEMDKLDFPPAIQSIKNTLRMADRISRRITDDCISMKNALKLALKLEESAVETYTNQLIAKLVSCDDEESYDKLMTEEKTHIDKIRKMIRKMK